jgi:hypothetical protein
MMILYRVDVRGNIPRHRHPNESAGGRRTTWGNQQNVILGLAAWVQERSLGHPDPATTACLRFLEALRTVIEG